MYLCWVGQLGTMCGNDLLHLEEEALAEATKVPGHGWRCVQLQARRTNLMVACFSCCMSAKRSLQTWIKENQQKYNSSL